MKIEGRVVGDLEAFLDAGRRLREVDPQTFRRVLALCRAYVANHDRDLESGDVWRSRLLEISADKVRGSA